MGEICEKCGSEMELLDEASLNPITQDHWKRYKCNDGHETVTTLVPSQSASNDE